MGKAMGPSFLTLKEVKSIDLLKKGDIIQIWRGSGYMHTVLFKDYEHCYHVVEKNDKYSCSSFKDAFKTGTIGTSVHISNDYDSCYHVVEKNDKYSCSSFKDALNTGTIGTTVYICKDHDSCYHVVEKNDKYSCSSFRNAFKNGTIGTSVYISKDCDSCNHVVEKNDKNTSSSFRNGLKTGTIRTPIYISKDPLEYILYARDSNEDTIIQTDSDGKIIPLKLDTLRVNNLEILAENKGINVEKCNSEKYLNDMFKELDDMINKPICTHLLIRNCESNAYEWKYGEKWTQDKVAISGIANVTISDIYLTTLIIIGLILIMMIGIILN